MRAVYRCVYKLANISAVYRGYVFCQAFAEIGTLGSVLSKSVKILVTVTKDTAECIMECLSMKNPTFIGISIDHSNIKHIDFPWVTLEELSKILVDELLTECKGVVKIVLFCRTLLNCADIYRHIKGFLGKYILSLRDFLTLWNCSR